MGSNGLARSADRLKRLFKPRRDKYTRNALPYWPFGSTHQDIGLPFAESSRPYRPLDSARQEIRLLVVKPGSENEMVDCSFQHASLKKASKPHYETISYVWGDENLRSQVSLEGENIDVPASSERVLRRFRLVDAPRTLWIDAVCINQNDQEERSSQVALMYEIFSCPVKNLIWLGEDNGTARRALDGIHLLVNDIKVETNDITDIFKILYDDSGTIRIAATRTSISLLPEQVHAMVHFYSSEWFRRLWVVQEAALAPSSVCYRGDTELSLQDVLLAATWIYHKQHSVPRALATHNGILNALHMVQTWGHRWTNMATGRDYNLYSVLINTGNFEATDPKDNVFAVLGLARKLGGVDKTAIPLRPDYSKSTSAIFRDATLYCIYSRQNLDVLNFVRHRLTSASLPDLPTWVLACHQMKDVTIDASQLRDLQYNACFPEANIKPFLQQSHDGDLAARGTVIGESEWVSQPMWRSNWDDIARAQQSEIYLHVWPSSDKDCAAFNSPDRLDLAMTLTAGCNNLRERWSNESCLRSSIAYDKVVEGEEVAAPRELTAASTNDQRLAAEFGRAMYYALKNRCLFSTKSGQIGLGPQTMQSGDVMAILYGCRLPVVLRQLDSDNGRYEFVGVCYMYRNMDGEAVAYHRAAGKEDVIFTLV